MLFDCGPCNDCIMLTFHIAGDNNMFNLKCKRMSNRRYIIIKVFVPNITSNYMICLYIPLAMWYDTRIIVTSEQYAIDNGINPDYMS